jgi:hypothetical protein
MYFLEERGVRAWEKGWGGDSIFGEHEDQKDYRLHLARPRKGGALLSSICKERSIRC